MKIRLKLILLLVCFQLVAFAQADVTKISEYIEHARQIWDVPGMAVAIVKDDEILLNKGYGIKTVNDPDPVDENTLFAIASNTKAFISSALATLVDEGKIQWNDKVKQYLPYFELYDHYVNNEMTILDLLCHRSGLGTFSGDIIWYKSDFSPEETIRHARYVPQNYGFRTGYGYSNLMFITAGEIIKAVTGKKWNEYIEERFFVPLVMSRTITSTNSLHSKGNYAMPHKPKDNENMEIPWVSWDNMGAAGGIISSVNDMAQWLILNLNHGIAGVDTLIHPDQQNLLWTFHNNFVLSENSKQRIPGRHFTGYGLGWGLSDYYGRMIVSHGGGYDGMYSRVVMVPDENLGIVILTNTMKGISAPLSYYIINAFIGEDQRDWCKDFLPSGEDNSMQRRIKEIKAAHVEGTKSSVLPQKFCGLYRADMHGDIQVTLKDGDMRLNFERAPHLSATLRHWHYDTFEIVWDEVHAWFDFGIVQFQLDPALNVTGMRIDVPNNDIFFDELKIRKVE